MRKHFLTKNPQRRVFADNGSCIWDNNPYPWRLGEPPAGCVRASNTAALSRTRTHAHTQGRRKIKDDQQSREDFLSTRTIKDNSVDTNYCS